MTDRCRWREKRQRQAEPPLTMMMKAAEISCSLCTTSAFVIIGTTGYGGGGEGGGGVEGGGGTGSGEGGGGDGDGGEGGGGEGGGGEGASKPSTSSPGAATEVTVTPSCDDIVDASVTATLSTAAFATVRFCMMISAATVMVFDWSSRRVASAASVLRADDTCS